MSSDLGIDRSGNGNNFTVNNMTVADQVVDSPTNNFCTINPLDEYGIGTLSEGNLKSVHTTVDKIGFSTFGMTSGKWYWEAQIVTQGVRGGIGIASKADRDGWTPRGGSNVYAILFCYDGEVDTSATDNGNSSAASNGSIYSFAFDADNGSFWVAHNSAINISSTAQATGLPSKTWHMFEENSTTSTKSTHFYNFGQDSSFAGTKTAQGNQDSGGIGDFYYTPPTGYLALCTKNLPDVAVTPSEHFNTVLWTGDGSTKSITGVGFQPDLVWGKNRAEAWNHTWFDAVRGTGKLLQSNLTNAETTNDAWGYLSAFNSDGFTLTAGSSGIDQVNDNNDAYVAWNWKANGSGSANTTGSINTTATSANVDAGFSIVSYTGNGTAGATVGHGLSKAPEMIIHKQRTDSNTWWAVFHKDNGNAQGFYLNDTRDIEDFSSVWNSTSPSSSVITFGTNNLTNENLHDYVLYAFHSVDGYSKVGSYTGNGNADGTFVYTGFRPAYVLIKPSSRGGHWMVANNKSSPSNVVDKVIFANASAGEYTDPNADCKKDFFSNGFKIRTTDDNTNENNATYIYIAFAETPFKYSNAR